MNSEPKSDQVVHARIAVGPGRSAPLCGARSGSLSAKVELITCPDCCQQVNPKRDQVDAAKNASSDVLGNAHDARPAPGDEWSFKLPGKSRRVKVVDRIEPRTFLKEAGSKETIELDYVHWQRQNKGRYTGITVRRLVEVGHRVSTKAERAAHLAECIERAEARRDAKRALATTQDNSGS